MKIPKQPFLPGIPALPTAKDLSLSKYAPFLRTDPFHLPAERKFRIAVPGGRTSSYLLYRVLDRNGGLPDNAVAVFTNTGKEAEETLEFLRMIEERWEVKIHWVEYRYDPARPGGKRGYRHYYEEVDFETASRNGEPFIQSCRAHKSIPGTNQRFCTSDLKINTADRFCQRELKWPKNNYWTLLGIRADEARRAAVAWLGECKSELPLMSAGIDRGEIMRFWDAHPFKLNAPFGNCDFCSMKPQKLIRRLAAEFPGRLKEWIDIEEAYGKGFTFRRDGSMREISEMLNPSGKISLSEDEINLTCYCGDD